MQTSKPGFSAGIAISKAMARMTKAMPNTTHGGVCTLPRAVKWIRQGAKTDGQPEKPGWRLPQDDAKATRLPKWGLESRELGQSPVSFVRERLGHESGV